MVNLRLHANPAPAAGIATELESELQWLRAVIDWRFALHFAQQPVPCDMPAAPAPGPWLVLFPQLALSASERLVLILALAPQLAPELLDPLLLQNQATGRRFSEFGGLNSQSHSGFLPTIETAIFLLAGADVAARLQALELLGRQQPLRAARLLAIDSSAAGEPRSAAALRLSEECLAILLASGDGEAMQDFAAERIDTPLVWDDLVLDPVTRSQIDMIGAWMRHSRTLMQDWGLARRLKPGYRCLFHGPPGTGKTLTASLLGKHHGMPVYRVDLSRVISKWIGETEKNLALLFDRAQDRDWILYFDEAEALFGRRTEASTANDRSANQQVAYLLQRMEDFPGTIILSTNQRGHMDEAFARRFQSTILFPMPDEEARLTLWEKLFRTGRIALADNIDFAPLASQYPLAGGAIINVLRYACLRAVMRSPAVVQLADIMAGVKLELQKEGQYTSR
ncbi:ATP-binding protein [Duganella sp. sic0402]|uniref:ATP-binding protein n=1 Tax=Duganella sp. sic0402 TaxID=2854786 RepID=UPI001C492DA0|nr:ATP-binding protein [Duganella sp. sic0402]MBV7534708.1 ATP-binding protein [Duganella sp. sic0402]